MAPSGCPEADLLRVYLGVVSSGSRDQGLLGTGFAPSEAMMAQEEKAIRFFVEEVDSVGRRRKAYYLCEKCRAVMGGSGDVLGFRFCPWCGVPLAAGFIRETKVIGG